ncbi:hypothetical protein BWD09_13070 [Neisseria dentiae]|uniref:Uncharacterized protein n=1 Tax=Neisseria dentiae TaxID=194197 RepID=A0A1X3D165_9NEIS|nr:hypothetical protein [Neisseria dentiae]OSI13653.1 hypothetical protein BWD09_13070 [Neisseria dentiae]QMT46312.1 hypothetical protein H3L92_06025 [Neisseria dentiae]STZ52531.1 Uncharacterised protein [Neisseria dentiae]
MKKLSALLLGLMLAANVYAAGSAASGSTAVQSQNTVKPSWWDWWLSKCPPLMPLRFCPYSPDYIEKNR